MKKQLNIKADKMRTFLEYKFALYGDCITDWWLERGVKDFLAWADKKGINFKETNENQSTI